MKKTLIMLIFILFSISIAFGATKATVTILAPPYIANYSISPINPTTNDYIICDFTILSTLNYTYSVSWISPAGRVIETAALPPQLTSEMENWTCRITATNIHGTSEKEISTNIAKKSAQLTGSFVAEPIEMSEPSTSIFYKFYLLVTLWNR